MEETSEELPNSSIDTDLLGPYPTRNKNKVASCTFLKFVGRPVAANFGRKTFTGNQKRHQLVINNFKGKISAFIVVFKFVQPGE